MRIVSLIPSATEILYLLGLDDQIIGVTHECDYPPQARSLPKVIRTVIDQEHASSREIDQAVQLALQQRQSLYEIDESLLQTLEPDLIVTQELCEVCAIDASQVARAIGQLSPQPRMLSLHPHTLEEVFDDIHRVGEATQREHEAARVVDALRERIARVRRAVIGASRPRVFCLEWLDPPMNSGHWVPEMVALAGGEDVLGRVSVPSRYVTEPEIIAANPDVLIVMPCGFSLERTRKELSVLTRQAWWHAVPAVRSNEVYLVNGPAYFNRSGPRLIDGTELLAAILHPDRASHPIAPDAVERLTTRS